MTVSFVSIAPEAVSAAVRDLAAVGSAINAANATAAASTTALAAADGDEVSAAIAKLFGNYGQQYQAVSATPTAVQEG